MKRLLIALLLFAAPTQAGPRHWVKTHKRFLFAAGAEAAAFTIQWKGQTYCQRGEHEACTLGYGGYRSRGFNWFSLGMSGAMLGAAEGCWKNEGGKFCNVLAYGVPATQTAFGIHDYLSYRVKD
jgi:hypothetical protein